MYIRYSSTIRSIYIGILLVCLPLSTYYLRLHIRELSQVVRTYSTFYPYLASHPQTLFRHTGSTSESRSATAPTSLNTSGFAFPVPRHLHQIHLQEGRPSVLAKHSKAILSCRTLHSDWNHTIWTDETGTKFIQEHYQSLYPHYVGYKQSIQRANILRYALLDHFGGVYLDLDVTCRHSLEGLRDITWLTPGAHPAGVNNAFILARQGHPFLTHLLDAVPSRDLNWRLPYIENMLSTGCMFFSNMWMSYIRSGSITSQSPENAVYILADQSGGIESHMLRGVVTTPLFKHGGASSWHGWDAAAIVMIGKYYSYMLIFLVISLVVTCGIWRLSWRRSRRRRGSVGIDA